MKHPSQRFLAQLAHDLRSPLNVIGSTLTELSTAPEQSAEREQSVTLAQRAAERLLALSDRLALASRLETPFDVALEPIDLATFTRDTLGQFVPAQLRKRLEAVTVFPATPVPVAANGPLLSALLRELLSNANRFARRQFRVEVSLGLDAEVTVDDDGDGVKEDERAVLFEPFAERRSRSGLGMGLWLARRLAELHGGTVTVEHLSGGTRQRLTLPIRPGWKRSP